MGVPPGGRQRSDARHAPTHAALLAVSEAAARAKLGAGALAQNGRQDGAARLARRVAGERGLRLESAGEGDLGGALARGAGQRCLQQVRDVIGLQTAQVFGMGSWDISKGWRSQAT